MSRKFPLPGLTIAAVWTVFWWPVISGDAYLYIRDLTLFAAPMKHYMMARFASGELPVWTPYVSGGMPFLADPSNQVFYPPNILFFLFTSVERALSLSLALHNLLGMCAFAWLCRVLGVSRWIAAWSGITYGLAGYILSISDNVNFLPAVAWVPLAIAAYQLGIDSNRYRYSALAALYLSFVVLAGDPQDAVLLVAVLALISIVSMPFRTPRPDWRRTTAYFPGVHLVLTVALTLLIAGVQVLPTLELLPVSSRHSTLPYDQIAMWSFPLARLLELFQPYIFGNQYPTFDFLTPDFYPAFAGPWADSVYLGTIPFLFALVGVASPDRTRLVWLVVLIAALMLSFGANTPVHEIVVEYVPFVGTQRYPEKLLFWVTLSACLLASSGAQALFDNRQLLTFANARLTLATKLAAGTAVVVLFCWLTVYLPAKYWFWRFAFTELGLWKVRVPFSIGHLDALLIHAALMLGVALAGLLANPKRRGHYLSVVLIVAVLDLFWVHASSVPSMPAAIWNQSSGPFALRHMAPLTEDQPYRIYFDTKSPGDLISFPKENPFNAPIAAGLPDGEDPVLRGYPHLYSFLYRRDRLHPNIGVFYGVQYLNGPLSPVQPRANLSYETYLRNRDPYKATALANIRYVVTGIEPKNSAWDDDRFVNVETNSARNLRVLENTDWLPRVLLVPNAIGTNNGTGEDSRELDDVMDPRSHVIIASKIRPQTVQLPVDVPLSVRRPSPERYEVDGSSPYRRAYLLLNESFMDGWQATVNGQAAEVFRANLRFMAVPVGAGPFEVIFEYRSRPLLIGAWMSGIGLLLCAGFLIGPAFKRRDAD